MAAQKLPQSQHRISIRPTGFGLAFLGVVIAVFLVSVHFSNNLAFALCFFLVGLAISSVWLTYTNLNHLDVTVLGGAPTFATQDLAFRIEVKNGTARPRWALELSAVGCASDQPFSIGAQGNQTQVLSLPTQKRGWLEVQELGLSTRFPLGIFQACLKIKVPDHLQKTVIYPRLTGEAPLPLPKQPDGVRRVDQVGDFSDVREYERGDSLASIAWKLSSKSSGRLITKSFDGGEGVPQLWLAWDQVQLLGQEAALSQLATWVVQAQREGRAFGLSLPDGSMPIDTGERHVDKSLTTLALYQTDLSRQEA